MKKNEMHVQIVIDATIDLQYVTVANSSPTEQMTHVVRVLGERLFGEDFASLFVGRLRIEARDPAIYPNYPIVGRLHTEMRNETKGFDSEEDLRARWGFGYGRSEAD